MLSASSRREERDRLLRFNRRRKYRRLVRLSGDSGACPGFAPRRDPMSIKDDAELAHVLGHLWNAIDHAITGENDAAAYELDAVKGLIFFEDELARANYLKGETQAGDKLPTPK